MRLWVPVIEHLDQPVRVRRAGRVGAPSGRRHRPRAMRQHEIDLRRREVGQRLIRPHRVVAQVNGAQQAAVQVRKLLQPAQRRRHICIAAPAAREPAVPVMSAFVPVEADPDQDP